MSRGQAKTYNLSSVQFELVQQMHKIFPLAWRNNILRIMRTGVYTELDKKVVLIPLRKKYIEHLKRL